MIVSFAISTASLSECFRTRMASFNHSLNACQLDERFVLDEKSGPELIASVIVHEATHARLMRCGIGYEEDAPGSE